MMQHHHVGWFWTKLFNFSRQQERSVDSENHVLPQKKRKALLCFIFMLSPQCVAIAIFSDHRHTNSFMFPIYLEFLCVLWNHQHHRNFVYKSCMYKRPIFFYMFYDSWGAFWFFGFLCFAFILFFPCRQKHTLNILRHHTQQTRSRKEAHFVQFLYFVFCRYNNHPPTRKARQKINSEHVKTFQDVCEVQCCVNFKSRSRFSLYFLWLGSSWIYCWRTFLLLPFHRWTNRIKLYRRQFITNRGNVMSGDLCKEDFEIIDSRFLSWIIQTFLWICNKEN